MSDLLYTDDGSSMSVGVNVDYKIALHGGDPGHESYRASTLDALQQAIEQLDNAEWTGVSIYLSTGGIIQIFGGFGDRVNLAYQNNQQDISAELTDPAVIVEDEIPINIGGEVSPTPLRLTVTKQEAYRAISHFLEQSRFPTDLVWEGHL